MKRFLTTSSQAAQNRQKLSIPRVIIRQQQIHWKICREYKIKTTEKKWYKHQTVTENQDGTIFWDMPIQTDREIKVNKSDFVIKKMKYKACMLTHIAASSERTKSVKVTEKHSQYNSLENDVSRMWNMKTKQSQSLCSS